MASNQLQFIKQLLYTLNRNYGVAIDIYRSGPQTVDNVVGTITASKFKYHIRRAIRLPDRRSRSSQVDSFLIKSNYEVSDREIIIETKQLPKNFIPLIGDNIVFEHIKYIVKTVVALDLGLGFFLAIGSTDGDAADEIHSRKISDQILFQGTVTT